MIRGVSERKKKKQTTLCGVCPLSFVYLFLHLGNATGEAPSENARLRKSVQKQGSKRR